jgi:hypothetical protein
VSSSSSFAFSHHLCAGDVYNLNGQMLSAPGQYLDTITNATGCDSIISLTLSVDTPVGVSWSAATDTVMPHSNVILLTATPAGGVYTGTGVRGNLFFPDSAGIGANVITYTYTDQYGCSSQATRTYYLLSTGIDPVALSRSISLYPNPANDLLIAQSDLFATESKPVVSDMTGQTMAVLSEVEGDKIKFQTKMLAPGVYMIRFTIHGAWVTKKFIKED